MLSYTGSLTLYQTLTNNTSTANQTTGATLINEGIRIMLGDIPWPFLETTGTLSTVANQQSYQLPGNLARLQDVYILVGTYKYNPIEVTSADDWAMVNNPTGVYSDTVSYYYILGNTIQFWPTPASNGNTITFDYLQAARDISVADYTAGTIVTATNGSTSITGSGTSWTAGMAGKWLRITADSAANKGDGLWYKISSVGSATTLTLVAPYAGTSIAAGSAAYTIGDVSLIPEKYQIGPVYYATAEYWRKMGEDDRADRFEEKFNEVLRRLRDEEGTKGTSVVLNDGSEYSPPINPNLARFVS